MNAFLAPQATGFKLLKWAGTVVMGLGVAILLISIVLVVLGLMPQEQGLRMNPLLSILPLLYAIPVFISGHLLHWAVAVWENQQKSIELLTEIRDAP